MKRKLVASLVIMGTLGASAFAEPCSQAPFRGQRFQIAQEAYQQFMSPLDEPKIKREQLVRLRDKEKTCQGQAAFDYVLMMADMKSGDLQQAVEAMAVLLHSNLSDLEKSRLMKGLIDRFVMAREIRPAIDLVRLAIEKFPEQEKEFTGSLILLLTGTGQFDEARRLADRTLSDAMIEPTEDRIPYAGWLRLAVSEVSGDAGDRQKVVNQLSEYYGEETETLIAKDQQLSEYSTLLARRFDPDAQLRPLAPPKPNYPQRMAELYRNGICDVRFDVGTDGIPMNITAECSHDGFVEESVHSVSKVRFLPPVLNGVPQPTYDVVYPLEYILMY